MINNFSKKIGKTKAGFTIVELLVSIAIFAFMTAFLLAKYGTFNQSVLLTNLAYDTALTVRSAQTFGIGVLGATSTNSTVYSTSTSQVMIFLTSGTSWTVPSDWNSSNNTVEVIGGGGGGGVGASGAGNAGGGGGGGYSRISNLTLTPGISVSYQVGQGGQGANTGDNPGSSGTDTFFCNSSSNCSSINGSAIQVGAKAGAGGTNSGAAGGSAGAGVGSVRYAGGTGGSAPGTWSGAGGGGAGGINGNGGNGGSSSGGVRGGGGGGGSGGGASANTVGGSNGTAGGNSALATGGGAGGTAGSQSGGSGANGGGGGGGYGNCSGSTGSGGSGGNGIEWDASHGSGGGAGGGGNNCSQGITGGTGGQYGAGGGGGIKGSSNGGSGGNGANGIIVITYNVTSTTSTIDPSASFAYSYGVHFDDSSPANAQQFSELLYDNTYHSAGTQSVYNMRSQYHISNLCVGSGPGSNCNSVSSLDVLFVRPNPDAIIMANGNTGIYYSYAEVVFMANDGTVKRIVLRSTGQVAVTN